MVMARFRIIVPGMSEIIDMCVFGLMVVRMFVGLFGTIIILGRTNYFARASDLIQNTRIAGDAPT